MSFQKILISTVIILSAAACTPPEEAATKGPPSDTLPTPTVAFGELPASHQQRTALVIGNSAYIGNSFLSNPVNDAEDLAAALRGLYFDVIHRSNLNQSEMETVINQFMEKLSKNKGVGLFYFSGHGVQYGGENYLIPIGASQVLRAAEQLRFKAVAAGFVLASMKAAGNETNLIILDACRNAPFKSGFKGDMIPPGLTMMPNVPGALIAYAASPGGFAMNGTGRNSPYVKHLIAWMKKPQKSLNQILRKVRLAVHQETNGIQSPGYYDELNESFYFHPQTTTTNDSAEQQRLAREKEQIQRKQAELQAERERLAQEAIEQARKQAEAKARLARENAAIEQEKARLQAEQERLARLQEAVPDKYRLTVLATPAASRIRIMNIVPRYVPGIVLEPGKYDVLVEKGRYVASRQWITIQNQDVTLPVVLVEKPIIFRDRLKDGSQGPEMVWIPGGSFRMGDIQGRGDSDEQPVHSVSVSRFAMGRYEVTFAEYDKFAEATGRGKPDDEGWGRGNRPVINVSWDDATAYTNWLSRQTGQSYRLPTEAQWEYAARAGTTTSRYWGNDPNEACRYANVNDNTSKQKNGYSWAHHNCTDGYAQTAPVGRFKPNAFDLFDMLGNVWEWTCSEFEDKYAGKEQRCADGGSRLVFRGGSWYVPFGGFVRAANRHWDSLDNRRSRSRSYFVGFRLARSS